MGVSSKHLAQVVHSKQQIHQISAWEKIQKFGRPPPWLITSRRSRSSPIQFPDAPTSAESLDTRSTAVDSPPLLALRLLLPKLPEQPIPRRERSSGSTSARNQMSMLMVNPSVLVPQTRLESMLSLEMSLVILLRLMKKNSSRSLKDEFPGLVHMRIPVCNSAAPLEGDFDILVKTLIGSNINTPVIINDQVGLSRATTGCVAACLFKEFQITSSFEGLVETVPGMNLGLLKMDTYKMDMAKDTLFRGEFPVVMRLVEGIVGGASAKNICDKVVDKNGTPKTGGTGIKQLRENIAESKLSYEIMDDAAQAFLKMKIMDNIHKYYYLILYTAYIQQAGELARESVSDEQKAALTLSGGRCAIPGDQLKLAKTFVAYCDENKAIRDLIETGKGNLQWERDIPPAALSNLESLAKSDFKANLGKIIHDIYQTAHIMFSDMPQGDHKKRAKYRFASKTLMRILPPGLDKEIEGAIEKKSITLDLYEILGQCTWGKA